MPTNTDNRTFLQRLGNYYWTPGASLVSNLFRAGRGLIQGPASIPGALGSAVGGEIRQAWNERGQGNQYQGYGPDPAFGSYTGAGVFPSMLSPNQGAAPGANYNPWANPDAGSVPMYDPATGEFYNTPAGYGVLPLSNSPQPGRQSEVGRDGHTVMTGEAAQNFVYGLGQGDVRATQLARSQWMGRGQK